MWRELESPHMVINSNLRETLGTNKQFYTQKDSPYVYQNREQSRT